MSAQGLADACSALGYASLTRAVIANLETGARDSISVPEWLALAAGLRVPPLLLLFPVGRAETVEPLPDVEVPPYAAVKWAEDGNIVGVDPPFTEDGHLIHDYRDHGRLLDGWHQSRHAAMRLREILEMADEELAARGEDRRDVERELQQREQAETDAVVGLRRIRRELRAAGASLPPDRRLPAALARQLGEDEQP